MLDDKQKIMVLGALGVAVLGIGAFQLMPSGPETPPGPKSSGWKPPVTATETAAPEPPKNPTVVSMLPRRDPFGVPNEFKPRELQADSVAPTIDPLKTPELPKPSFDPGRRGRRKPGSMKGRLPINPFADEDPGELPDAGSLKIEKEKPNLTNPTVPPVEPPKPPEPTFDYTLSGVIIGRRSAAVLRDTQGNQRLVTTGGMIDGEATLIEVKPGLAIVDVRGKRMRIEVKGDTDAK
jgi:hypothetical protein